MVRRPKNLRGMALRIQRDIEGAARAHARAARKQRETPEEAAARKKKEAARKKEAYALAKTQSGRPAKRRRTAKSCWPDARKSCNRCGGKSHSRKSSKDCPANPKHKSSVWSIMQFFPSPLDFFDVRLVLSVLVATICGDVPASDVPVLLPPSRKIRAKHLPPVDAESYLPVLDPSTDAERDLEWIQRRTTSQTSPGLGTAHCPRCGDALRGFGSDADILAPHTCGPSPRSTPSKLRPVSAASATAFCLLETPRAAGSPPPVETPRAAGSPPPVASAVATSWGPRRDSWGDSTRLKRTAADAPHKAISAAQTLVFPIDDVAAWRLNKWQRPVDVVLSTPLRKHLSADASSRKWNGKSKHPNFRHKRNYPTNRRKRSRAATLPTRAAILPAYTAVLPDPAPLALKPLAFRTESAASILQRSFARRAASRRTTDGASQLAAVGSLDTDTLAASSADAYGGSWANGAAWAHGDRNEHHGSDAPIHPPDQSHLHDLFDRFPGSP